MNYKDEAMLMTGFSCNLRVKANSTLENGEDENIVPVVGNQPTEYIEVISPQEIYPPTETSFSQDNEDAKKVIENEEVSMEYKSDDGLYTCAGQ